MWLKIPCGEVCGMLTLRERGWCEKIKKEEKDKLLCSTFTIKESFSCFHVPFFVSFKEENRFR